MCGEKFLLVTCKILRLFIGTLTADDKYSLVNRDSLTHPIEIHFSQKQKLFSQYSAAFSKSKLIFQDFQKNMTLIAYVFRKLLTLKDVVR